MRCGNAEARPFLYVIISEAPRLCLFLYVIISEAPRLFLFLYVIISGAPRLFLFLYILYIVYRKLCPAAAGIWILPKIMTGATPTNFGAEHSGSVIGVQMAFAYCGMTFTPILFGKLAEATTIRLLPFGVALPAGLVLLFTELLNRSVAKRKAADIRR